MSRVQRYAGDLLCEDYVNLLEDGDKITEALDYGK